ncbi:TfoX/Sxy family protein [Acetobacterium paludosum]|uniref:TfoX/Sxy family protein n=1 Tax=Acetobacterium paludosum TaxID=52693 RepID=UPI001FAD0339|nr:TfoX/Sxy family protein [Acetobacterium paludosum]
MIDISFVNRYAFSFSMVLLRLCGLEGAIRGIRWHYLDDNLKKELKSFYETSR